MGVLSLLSMLMLEMLRLLQVSEHDIGYKDSLMLFAKDLGPTAQNIAKRKLLGCEIRTVSTSAPCRPDTSNGREKIKGPKKLVRSLGGCYWTDQTGAIESTDVSGNNFMFGSKCVMGDREVTTEISCSSDQAMKSDQTVPPASNFVFNLPYLKTRLNQINSSD
ncbi:hypothetical protein JHK87_005774 [Glycine soja]|nr:hypothetical protein JHK87_005774 [Glycine soja]